MGEEVHEAARSPFAALNHGDYAHLLRLVFPSVRVRYSCIVIETSTKFGHARSKGSWTPRSKIKFDAPRKDRERIDREKDWEKNDPPRSFSAFSHGFDIA